ncbi:MAG: hypothetical protein K2I03_00080 [Lachnospiraceae bacterium]|nr:hypothetical protein [Lachnospiraceae bacterium]
MENHEFDIGKIFYFKKKLIFGTIAIIVGVFIIGINFKFDIERVQGKYKSLPAVITDYEEVEIADEDDIYVHYYKYKYGYEENGRTGLFKGSANMFKPQIGKKVYLYRNKNTNKIRESPKISVFYGVVCICAGAILIFWNRVDNLNRERIRRISGR